MDGLIIQIAKNIALLLGQDGIFILFTSLITLTFIINLILSCCVCDYRLKKRLWQPLFSVFLVCVCVGLCSVAGYGNFLAYLIIGFSVLTFIPVLYVRVKSFKVTEKQRDLVKFIDRNILDQNSTCIQDTYCINSCENLVGKEEIRSSASDFEVDFQHVKSVIARLDYFGLKESDKKQVKELENALAIAERGEFNQQVKLKINDGLGALLKIMSKYGI